MKDLVGELVNNTRSHDDEENLCGHMNMSTLKVTTMPMVKRGALPFLKWKQSLMGMTKATGCSNQEMLLVLKSNHKYVMEIEDQKMIMMSLTLHMHWNFLLPISGIFKQLSMDCVPRFMGQGTLLSDSLLGPGR